MYISFTQQHTERKKRMAEKLTTVTTSFVDVDEKWGTVRYAPQPPATCDHVWISTSSTHTACGKCRAKAVWDSVRLTFRLTGE